MIFLTTSRLRVLFVFGLSVLSAALSSAADTNLPDAWKTGREGLIQLGSGFVVWESNRTGNWRIWKINLDGSGQRQLSPAETGQEHYCPHISPNGRRLVYISYPKGYWSRDPLRKLKGPLHLMNADGTNDRVIVDDVRMLAGNRAAVWLNDRELLYIGPDRMTYRLDINTGKSVPILKEAAKGEDWSLGYLVNSKLTSATSGVPTFSIFNGKTKVISLRQKQQGSQPYFSHDGLWGFWMGGAGGPINRINLASGQASPIINKSDARLPKERNYLYFPMLSRCGRLFAFGASPNQHDPVKSDYDIFVSRIDPKTLELIGEPVRYTFDPACDRFPDVFLDSFELGEHKNKAPFTLDVAALSPDLLKGQWICDFGDGTMVKTAPYKHTYTKAGDYEIEARQGEVSLRGRAQIRPATAPQALNVLLKGEREIAVQFDQPVQLQNLSLSLESNAKIERSQLAADGQSLSIFLETKLAGEDILLLNGIADKAQKPNKMAPVRLTVKPLTWPSTRENLVFLWENGRKPNLVFDATAKTERTFALKTADEAYFNRDFAMRIDNGAFLVEGADDNLLAACKKSGELSIEATILPANLQQSGPTRIISFSSDTSVRNFTIGQEKDKLILRLRTVGADPNRAYTEISLCPLSATEPNHIVVTYAPGKLICFRNGQEVFKSDALKGNFSNWMPHHLLFGDEWGGGRRWAGTLEGIALYARALSASEIRSDYEQYRAILQSRQPVPRVEVQAKLIGRSKIPTLNGHSAFPTGTGGLRI